MRIGLVASEFPPMKGGMQKMGLCVAQGLTHMGHTVEVFTTENNFKENPKAAKSIALCNPNISIRYVLVGTLSRDAAVIDSISRLNYYDVWLVMNAGYSGIAPLRQPIVTMFHGNDFLRPWLCTRDQINDAIPKLKGICVNSAYTANILTKVYPTAKDKMILQASPGVDMELFALNRSAYSPGSQFRVIIVSRLDVTNPRKNVDNSLQAVIELISRRVNIRCDVVGHGSDLYRLKKNYERYPEIRFLGNISEEELYQAYSDSHALLLPIADFDHDIEGFGMVCAEANAAGIPVIGSVFGNQAFVNGYSGIALLDVSWSNIAETLKNVIKDYPTKNWTEKCRKAASIYTWSNCCINIEKALLRAIGR